MALYESLNRQDRVTAVPYGSSHPMTAAAPAISMDEVIGAARAACLACLLLCWIVGAYAGIVYWSLQGSLLGVVASAVIPGIAATSTWWGFATLERLPGRHR